MIAQLDDDLPWDDFGVPVEQIDRALAPTLAELENDPSFMVVPADRPTYTELCRKCGGKGKISIGYHHPRMVPCFTCKGAGSFERKTSPEARQKARASTAARKVRTLEENLAGFTSEHPEVAAWLNESASSFEFAASLLEGVHKFGGLTPNQLAAAKRAIVRRDEARAARAAREAAAVAVDIDRIARAFAAAQASGLKRPKLNLGEFRFSLAPTTGINAGAIYVKAGETYLGKVMGGKFNRSRDCTDKDQDAIVAACVDPFAAAVAHGQRTGQCSCCQRELTNAESIRLGVGPICRAKWGL